MACAFVTGPHRGLSSVACAFASDIHYWDVVRTEREWVRRGLRLRSTHRYANDLALVIIVPDEVERVAVLVAAVDDHEEYG